MFREYKLNFHKNSFILFKRVKGEMENIKIIK